MGDDVFMVTKLKLNLTDLLSAVSTTDSATTPKTPIKRAKN